LQQCKCWLILIGSHERRPLVCAADNLGRPYVVRGISASSAGILTFASNVFVMRQRSITRATKNLAGGMPHRQRWRWSMCVLLRVDWVDLFVALDWLGLLVTRSRFKALEMPGQARWQTATFLWSYHTIGYLTVMLGSTLFLEYIICLI
jgi:hypothetical protein